MKLGDLFIKLGLKSEEFERGIDKTKGALNGLGAVAKTIGGVIVAAFSVRAIVNFFTTSVQLANEQIAVENRLAAAVKANGKDVESTMQKYRRFASEMQKTTTVGDEMTLSLIQLAESMRSKAPMEAAKMAIGLSKALGMDLQTATRAATLAQNGNFMALSRYIPAVRSATTEAEKLAAVQHTVASGMQIANDEIKTMPGRIQQMKNAWGDFQEVVGSVIATNETLLNSLTDLTTAIQMLTTKNFGITSFLAFLSGGKSWAADKKRFEEFLAQQKLMNEAMDEYEANVKNARSSIDGKNQAEEKHIKTIGELKAETDELKKSLDDYTINQHAEIQATLRQIKANEDLIKTLTTLQEVRKPSGSMPAISPGVQFTGFEAVKIDTSGLDDMTAHMEATRAKAAALLQEMRQDWDMFAADLALTIEQGIVDTIYTLAESFGELFAGSISGDEFFNNILGQLADFAKQLGGMLIAFGIAQLAFAESMKNIFNPASAPVLIAAGAALVGLGGAIGALTRAKSSGGGGGGGSASGSADGQFGVYGTNQFGSQLVGTMQTSIRGNELNLIIGRESKRNSVIG